VKVAVLHNVDALGPPSDPVLGQVQGALQAEGHEPWLVCIEQDVQSLVDALARSKPDLVFNLSESFGGKSSLDSNVAALLNLLGLRYTGSSPSGLMLAGDKTLCKKVLSFHKIRTPEFATLYRGALDHAGDLSFPLIVKPPQEDASLGITSKSVVHDLKEMLHKIDEIQEVYQQPVLVEEFIDGREFYIGILGNSDAETLPAIEMDFSKFPKDLPRIASYAAKWGDDGSGKGAEFDGTVAIFPDDLSAELIERMQKTALDAFQAMRLRDYARIDLRVNEAGEVFVIEVNPNCYLERSGEFSRAAERSGIMYEALIQRILELASARYSR
jgi:D-alanine-D-alanine ligase